jgi:membrane protein DedA with SNARE-associated domain
MTEPIIAFLNQYGYLAVFLAVLVREIGVPDFLPPGFILAAAGALAVTTTLSAWGIFVAATIGDIIGATILYFVFRILTHHAIEKLERVQVLPWRTIHRYTQKLHERSSHLFVGRITPFIRGYVAVSAGIAHMPYGRYFWIVVLSSALWNAAFVIGGYFVGGPLLQVMQHLNWPLVVAGIAAGYAVVRIVLYLLRKRYRAIGERPPVTPTPPAKSPAISKAQER